MQRTTLTPAPAATYPLATERDARAGAEANLKTLKWVLGGRSGSLAGAEANLKTLEWVWGG